MAAACRDVDLAPVTDAHADAVTKVRGLGVGLSDRRAVKALKLVAASAVLCGRSAANASDFWVLRYAWDRVEQIGTLGALVTGNSNRPRGCAASRGPPGRSRWTLRCWPASWTRPRRRWRAGR